MNFRTVFALFFVSKRCDYYIFFKFTVHIQKINQNLKKRHTYRGAKIISFTYNMQISERSTDKQNRLSK